MAAGERRRKKKVSESAGGGSGGGGGGGGGENGSGVGVGGDGDGADGTEGAKLRGGGAGALAPAGAPAPASVVLVLDAEARRNASSVAMEIVRGSMIPVQQVMQGIPYPLPREFPFPPPPALPSSRPKNLGYFCERGNRPPFVACDAVQIYFFFLFPASFSVTSPPPFQSSLLYTHTHTR